MGKLHIVCFADGTRRTVASFSMGRAKLFHELTRLIEREYVPLPSGIADDDGQDEHPINPDLYLPFFEEFWKVGWLGAQKGGFLHEWARYAAGMIENITLKPKEWIDRDGHILHVQRYLRHEEVVERLAAKGIIVPPYPKQKASANPAITPLE